MHSHAKHQTTWLLLPEFSVHKPTNFNCHNIYTCICEEKNMRTHLFAFREEKSSWNSRRHLESENYIHFLIGMTTEQFIDVSFLFALKVHCDNCISLQILSMYAIIIAAKRNTIHSLLLTIAFCCCIRAIFDCTKHVRNVCACVGAPCDTLFMWCRIIFTFFHCWSTLQPQLALCGNSSCSE